MKLSLLILSVFAVVLLADWSAAQSEGDFASTYDLKPSPEGGNSDKPTEEVGNGKPENEKGHGKGKGPGPGKGHKVHGRRPGNQGKRGDKDE